MNGPFLDRLEHQFPHETAMLGRVFNRTTNSYKLYWFKAILSLMPSQDRSTIPIPDILREMVVLAWHTVAFFRLNLGRQDMLQNVINGIRSQTVIDPQSPLRTIRGRLSSSRDLDTKISCLGDYVPQRFLTPWFSENLRGLPDQRKDALIVKLAKEQYSSALPPFYDFAERNGIIEIRIHPAWRCFCTENLGVLRAFADFHLVAYLQRRNPSTPAIVDKLELPDAPRIF